MLLAECKKGTRIKYIPTHAYGDAKHPDCETGVIKSKNDKWVFVIYDNAMCTMVTGDEPYTAAATDPHDLIPW